MELRALVAIVLGVLGILCAVGGIFLVDGISIEFLGLVFAGLGYYFGLQSGSRAGRMLAIAAAVLNVLSMAISGLTQPPQ